MTANIAAKPTQKAGEAALASGRLHARRTPEQSVFYPTTLTEAILQRLD